MENVSCEMTWVRRLLREFGVITDNLIRYIDIAKNHVFHERTKHIEIDCHLIGDHVVGTQTLHRCNRYTLILNNNLQTFDETIVGNSNRFSS